MKSEPIARIPRRLEPVRSTASDLSGAESLDQAIRGAPGALFLLLYLPLIYWSGFALKATQMMDYPSFYIAARLAFIERVTPYGYGAFDDYSAALDRGLPPFVYPPPSLVAFWPLTVFSLENAFVVFTIVSHCCLLGTIWLILSRLIPLPEQRLLRTLILCVSVTYILFYDAVPATLNLGQINIITLFFICLSLTALVEDKPAWRIAWPLSVAILLKTYPVLLLILLIVRRRFRATALTIACFGVFVAIAALKLPTEIWASWRAEVLPAAVVSKDEVLLFSHSTVSFVWNQSLTGFFTRLFGDKLQTHAPLYHPALTIPIAHLAAALMIGVTALLTFCLWRKGNRSRGMLDDIAAFLLVVYLVAPVSWDHHLVFILPAAVLAIALIMNGSVPKLTAVALVIALCLLAWRMNLDAPIFKKSWWSILASTKFFGVVTLWLFFIHRIYRAAFRRDTAPLVLSHSPVPEL